MSTPSNTTSGGVAAPASDQIRIEIAWACRILAEHGYRDLTLGHVSARDPRRAGHVWIKRRGITLAEVRPEDVIGLDIDTNPRDSTDEMHLEAVLHTEVYRRRSDVGAIVHGHPPYATALGATDAELLHLTHDAVLFERGVSVYGESADLITEPEQGSKVAEALGDCSAVLLRNHGVLVAHRDLRWMVLAAVTLERAVMLQSIAGSLGRARPIAPEMIEDLNRRKYDDSLVGEYWQAWMREMRRRGLGLEEG